MTIEEMVSIEPDLKIIIDYVEARNGLKDERFKTWVDVWKIIKPKVTKLIGFEAANFSLCDSKIYDDFICHLQDISPNLK